MFSAVDDFEPQDGRPRRPNQDALLAQLGGPQTAMPQAPQPPAPPMSAPSMAAPVDPVPQAPQQPAKPSFSSDTKDGRGYLREATRWYQPELQKMSGADAEGASETFLKSLVPELQKRGLNVGDVKKEKVQIDGRWVDLYRDIGGASEAQWLEDDGSGGGQGPMPMMGATLGGLDPSLSGDPMAAIQAAIAQYAHNPNQKALLEQLGQ